MLSPCYYVLVVQERRSRITDLFCWSPNCPPTVAVLWDNVWKSRRHDSSRLIPFVRNLDNNSIFWQTRCNNQHAITHCLALTVDLCMDILVFYCRRGWVSTCVAQTANAVHCRDIFTIMSMCAKHGLLLAVFIDEICWGDVTNGIC